MKKLVIATVLVMAGFHISAIASDLDESSVDHGIYLEHANHNNVQNPGFVIEFYVSPVGTNNWGPNLLGPNVGVPANNKLFVRWKNNAQTCLYDLKVVWGGNSGYTERMNVDVCRGGETWIVWLRPNDGGPKPKKKKVGI